MHRKSNSRPYDKLALVYNGVMKHVDFKFWADYIIDIASEYADRKSSFLELAAGTCEMASIVQKKYPDITTSDISLPMMRTVFQNNLRKVCCDMLKLPFKKKFNFVYCTFDSINYLMTEKDVLSLFNEVKFILADEGIFTFDASLEKNSLEFSDMQITEGKYKEYNFKRISSYNKKTRIHKNVFHIRSDAGLKMKEIHKQKIYSFETYINLIDKAGLMVRECYDGFTFDDGDAESERVQFVVEKKAA